MENCVLKILWKKIRDTSTKIISKIKLIIKFSFKIVLKNRFIKNSPFILDNYKRNTVYTLKQKFTFVNNFFEKNKKFFLKMSKKVEK